MVVSSLGSQNHSGALQSLPLDHLDTLLSWKPHFRHPHKINCRKNPLRGRKDLFARSVPVMQVRSRLNFPDTDASKWFTVFLLFESLTSHRDVCYAHVCTHLAQCTDRAESRALAHAGLPTAAALLYRLLASRDRFSRGVASSIVVYHLDVVDVESEVRLERRAAHWALVEREMVEAVVADAQVAAWQQDGVLGPRWVEGRETGDLRGASERLQDGTWGPKQAHAPLSNVSGAAKGESGGCLEP